MIYTDGQTVLRQSGLFHKHRGADSITVDYTKHHPAFAERSMSTFNQDRTSESSLPTMDRIDVTDLVTCNNMLVYSTTAHTPQKASAQYNQLDVHIYTKEAAW